MSMGYGNNIARHVSEGVARVAPGTWIPLVSTGTTPLEGRQWIEIQVKGRMSLAITYSNKNSAGTFTTPTYGAHGCKIIPANTIKGEPLGDSIQMWGRAVNKAGSSDGGLRVIVDEFR